MQGNRWASLSASRFHEECSWDVNSKEFPYLLDGNETTSSSTSVSGEGGEWQRGMAATAFSSFPALLSPAANDGNTRLASPVFPAEC
nr:hypothetical protein Itr_chr14CG08750 [Ipomoea trifida]GLL46235.1 hypothetical protein Itr_chr14CG08760 [Ipomoea trifida]